MNKKIPPGKSRRYFFLGASGGRRFRRKLLSVERKVAPGVNRSGYPERLPLAKKGYSVITFQVLMR